MISAKWIKYYDELPSGNIVQSWVGGFRKLTCTTWMKNKNNYYLLDVYSEIRPQSPDNLIIKLAEKYNPTAVLFSESPVDNILIQKLRRETKLPIMCLNDMCPVIERAASICVLFEDGRIYLPTSQNIQYDFLNFPYGSCDQTVDSSSQYLRWERQKNTMKKRFII